MGVEDGVEGWRKCAQCSVVGKSENIVSVLTKNGIWSPVVFRCRTSTFSGF